MDLKTALINEVVPQLITLAGIVVGFLVVFARTELSKLIKGKVENEALVGTMEWVNSLVFDLVQAAAQTAVDETKKALADGKIDEQEYKAALGKIKDELVAKLMAKTVGRLMGASVVSSHAEAKSLLEAKVEAAVPLAKTIQNDAKAIVNPQ